MDQRMEVSFLSNHRTRGMPTPSDSASYQPYLGVQRAEQRQAATDNAPEETKTKAVSANLAINAVPLGDDTVLEGM